MAEASAHLQAGATGPREHGDETRARIVETALQLIADHGFSATSTREIAEHLGFTKAALYYHFRTKEDLLAAIVAPAMQELAVLAERGETAATPAERRALVEGYVDLVARHAELIRVIANDPGAKDSSVFTTTEPLFASLVKALSGTETPDLEQRVRVRCALGAIHLAFLRGDPEEDRPVVRQTACAAACSVLGIPAPRHARRAVQQTVRDSVSGERADGAGS
ncbi:MAG: TetR/AcrR family transcriptional regulator [Acidimicrobiales bacterium]